MPKEIKVSLNKNASKEYIWKFGVITNYGINEKGKCDSDCARVKFLGVSDKRPTYKFIKEKYNIKDERVITRMGTVKIQNCDIIILKRFEKGKKSSMFKLF